MTDVAIITLFATNNIISGNSSLFVNMTVDTELSIFICHFLKQSNTSEKSCSIRYGPGESCNNLSSTSQMNSTGNYLSLKLSLQPHVQLIYCFSVSARNGTNEIVTKGVFSAGMNLLLGHQNL